MTTTWHSRSWTWHSDENYVIVSFYAYFVEFYTLDTISDDRRSKRYAVEGTSGLPHYWEFV